jgi:epsilon-lactone hydrolase
VISVDYRMMPEHAFPAASEDVESVYRELIRSYCPKNIGMYGCSAGGVLTAESVAWLQSKNLPLLGAVGMFCGAGSFWSEGDSGNFVRLIEERPKSLDDDLYYKYFEHVDHNDPLAYPVCSPSVMARFPPSLLLTSTRDLALSSVVYAHTVLAQQNVLAELHVWEGLPHAFFLDPELPQSRDAYGIIVKFFERYLGTEQRARK